MLNPFIHWVDAKDPWAPWLFVALFLGASFLMIWRLEIMSARGFEGTVLGTLVMPYCSGLGNLIFAFILGHGGGNGADVMINSLVNNVTNMTLVLGLPAIFWGIRILPSKRHKSKASAKAQELNRLSLLMTLTAVLFFTGAVWALGRDGKIAANDGLVLVGLFLFWQCFHVFEVLKSNVRQGASFGWALPFDLILLGIGAYGIYVSIDWLVQWVSHTAQPGFIKDHLGWVSGWLMVMPNAILACYYSWSKQPEVVYASQVGDAHVSIPLCIGIFALYHTMTVPAFFQVGMFILLGTTFIHFLFVALLGQLPRIMGWILLAAYVVFLYRGLLS